MKRIFWLPIVLVFVLSCTISTAPEAVPSPQVIVITATQPPATSTPYPTYTPFPTATEVPATPTPYPTYTPYPSPTSGPAGPTASGEPVVTVSVDTQCRIGPGKEYFQLSGLVVGKEGKVVGKSADGLYWIIKNPTDIGNCWLWGEFATVTGNISNLKVFEVPDWLKNYTFKLVVSTVPDTVNIGKCYYVANLIDWPKGMVVTFQTKERIAGDWKQLASPQDFTVDSSNSYRIVSIGSVKIKGDLVETLLTANVNGGKTLIGLSIDDNNCR